MYVCKGVFFLLVLYVLAHTLDSVPLKSKSSAPLQEADPSLDSEWEKWKVYYEKKYKSPEEEAFRRSIWEQTKKQVETHNEEYARGLHTYTQGVNHFADMEAWEVC